MDFNLFLSCYCPDTGYPAARLYADMVEQARRAEALGFAGVTIPEHHFLNLLMNPSPLMLAVKVAAVTERIPITSSVLVLAYADMKRLAGEIALADCLTGGRIQLGVGRGAFAFEFDRFGVPIQESRERFDEALAVLEALLTEEEVSWDSENYSFPPLTVMPRPVQRPRPPIWIAALTPPAIYHSARRGYHIQTTALKPSPEFLKQMARNADGTSIPFRDARELIKAQAEAFHRGAAESGRGDLRLGLLRVGFAARDEADAKAKAALAHGYFRRFANLRETAGTVDRGAVAPIDIGDTVDDLAASLFVAPPEQLVERLKQYEAMGFDEINLNMTIGASAAETLDSIERFAAEVMPHFRTPGERAETA